MYMYIYICIYLYIYIHTYIHTYKSFSPYTNVSSSLIISSKNYISYPKILMKSAASVTGKCPRVLVLKKIVNSNQPFLLPCDVVVVLLHKPFSLICWHSCWICWYYDIELPLLSKIKLNSFFSIREKIINFQSFLFRGICKSRLYSLDVSTDIPILDSLLDFRFNFRFFDSFTNFRLFFDSLFDSLKNVCKLNLWLSIKSLIFELECR